MSLRLGLQRLLGNCNKSVMKNMDQRRCESAIAGPPMNSLSAAECILFGGGMFVGMLFMPIYTLFHLRENPEEEKE